MTSVVLATGNPSKLAELRSILSREAAFRDIIFVSPAEVGQASVDVEESGRTFAENARLKALQFAAHFGLPALADDSGLCVDALGGQPGIMSARWTGPGDGDRNRALLEKLTDVSDNGRAAHFVCVVAVATPDGRVVDASGACHGTILRSPAGDSGFGYDPIFYLPELGNTMAQLTDAQKNSMSHRARAIAAVSLPAARLLGTMPANMR